MDGQAVAAQLMLELTGATLQPGTVDVGGPGPEPKTLRLRDEKVTRLLGTEVPLGEQRDILERLEFGVTDNGDSFDVTVPYFRRNDVTREVDLIEEVARLWGLEKLPATIPGHGMSGRLTVEQKLRRRAGDALVGAGFREAIGWSFQAPETARKLRIDAPAVRLRNPLSEDLSDDADVAARVAARVGPPQHRARPRRRAAVRGGLGLLRSPARQRADRRGAALDAASGRADASGGADDRPGPARVVERRVAVDRRLLRREGRARDPAECAPRAVRASPAARIRSCTRAARRACS